MFQRVCWALMDYHPSPEQLMFHQDKSVIRLIAGGVRAGKSYCTAMEALKFSIKDGGLGWLIGRDYVQCQAEFSYMLECFIKMNVVVKYATPEKGPWFMELSWGFRWETKSANRDTRAIASFAPDIVILCEAALMAYDIIFKAVERASEQFAPIIMSGTFEKGNPWYAELFKELKGPNKRSGKSFSMPSWTNRKVYPGGRQDPKILFAEANLPPELFMERYGGTPHKPMGLVFPYFSRETHVKEGLAYNPSLPLEIAVDPGTHAYAILFLQWEGQTVYVIDEIYLRNIIAQQIIPVYLENPLSQHIRSGVMDIAGSQHHANYSQLEVWQSELAGAGRPPIDFRTRKIWEHDWRHAISLRVGNTGKLPINVYFAPALSKSHMLDGSAMGVVNELENYKWPDKNITASAPGRPVKRDEDALSAFGYWLVDHYGPLSEERKPVLQTSKTFDYWQ